MNPTAQRGNRLKTILGALLTTLALGVTAVMGTSSAAFTASIANASNTLSIGFTSCRAAASDALISWSLRSSDDEYTLPNLGVGTADYRGRVRGWAQYVQQSDSRCLNDVNDPGYLHFNAQRFVSSWDRLPAVGAQASMSQEVWVRTSNPRGLPMGIGDSWNGNSTTKGQAVYFNANGQVSYFTWLADGDFDVLVSPLNSADAAWHHVVATYDNGAKNLYIDGQLVGSSHHFSQVLTGHWRVGQDNLAGYPNTAHATDGIIGDMMWAALYSRALTAAEVQARYAAGAR